MQEKVPGIMSVVKEHLKRMKLSEIWKGLKDPRSERNLKWSFDYMMRIATLGMLSGCKNLRAVETFSEIFDERIPDTTIHDILVEIDPEPLRQTVVRGVKDALRDHELPKEEFPVRVTAIDGKSIAVSGTVVGPFSQPISGGGEGTFRNMALRAFHVSNETKLFLGQREIHGKTGEPVELRPFIDDLVNDYGNTTLLEVISVDAGMTSKANAEYIKGKGLHYIMALKGPQHFLFGEAQRLFADLIKPLKVSTELCNGKEVIRELYRHSLPSGCGSWEHLREFWLVKQSVIDSGGKITREDRYFLSSLPAKNLSNAHVLEAVRMHWGVENNGFWICDTVWQEDDAPWANDALVLTSHLRLIAYNIVSRLQTRRLRSAKARALSWSGILRFIEHACCQLKNYFMIEMVALEEPAALAA